VSAACRVSPSGAGPPDAEREIEEIERLLAQHRLLTLTGAGGSGKTRLALAVAQEVVRDYEDGAWLVELVPLSDADLVAQAVASVLSVREAPGNSLTETLVDHLGSKEMLLVLDNCEHLIDACASLADTLLRFCPNLRVLATSREALVVEGEALFVVPPLSLPDPRRLPAADDLSRYESARLFLERAKAVRPNFRISEQNTRAVAQVCYQLDGMPLAIELAAARAKVLSMEQISGRLERTLGLLSFGSRTEMAHHRTLRATMDWSHELLEERGAGPLKEALGFRRWAHPRGRGGGVCRRSPRAGGGAGVPFSPGGQVVNKRWPFSMRACLC
jgi:predicted ATPase